MDLNLDLTGRRVIVIGEARVARRSIARHLAAGAIVFQSSLEAGATPADVRRVEFPASVIGWRNLVSAVDLVVAVDLPDDAFRTMAETCRELRTWFTREEPSPTDPIGHVTLVGGGPGNEGLLTTAGKVALRRADVIFYDRLGPHEHLAEWAPGAELVNVGKTPGHHAVPQEEIQKQLVASALAGNTVVRLKGGDPFVFGRGGEEVIACRNAGVPVTVISGVTSAISVPAAAGIPVTHREVSRMFTIVSGHAPLSEQELGHLVGLDSTIVVLMGVTTLPHLAAGLARHGMRADMPVAIIERGFSATQRTTVATVSDIVEVASAAGARSPAVLVIGEVVRLSQDDGVAGQVLQHTVTLATQG